MGGRRIDTWMLLCRYLDNICRAVILSLVAAPFFWGGEGGEGGKGRAKERTTGWRAMEEGGREGG